MISEELYSVDNAKERFEELMHYGIKRRSGRYPWGSGEDPHQHGSRDFLGRVDELRKSNFEFTDEKGKKWTGDTAIAKAMGLTTGQFRTELAIANSERRSLQVATAKSLTEDGLGATEIGRRMGLSESTVRSLLNDKSEAKMNEAKGAADYIKSVIDKKAKDDPQGHGMIDIGTGTEKELNISKERLNQAAYLLEREGYVVYKGGISQVQNPGQQTNQRVICTPGTKHKEIYEYDRVHALNEDNYISRDGGKTFEKKFHYPASLDSKRLKILLKDEVGPDGEVGEKKDGIIQLRRDVPDLSLGESKYSQVRILVDGDKYLKGMAVYSDNMPDGIDVIFNSNKTSYEKALKKIKDDPDNPFGSAIKDASQGGQYFYDPKTGKRVSASTPNAKLGLINKRADEGDWTEWADTLPSQFLAKQSKSLAKKQLNLAKADKQAEYEDICSINNPTIKKHFLKKFAEECDAAAVHLKAAALPGQKYHVIIPVNSLKDDEVYAPGYEPGTKLALIRYPHGGTFEIPVLTVTHKNSTANKIIGKMSIDAVGINKKIADQLSGADFDGDTVMCIPTHDPKNKVKIKNRDRLEGLVDFDPQVKYAVDKITTDADGTKHAYVNGREVRLMRDTQKQMGVISNLITDMTLAGANDRDLAAAVRHSMVVIDAEKHSLDYKQSEIDNNIAALHKRYQGKSTGGAATIISKAKGEETVLKRQGTPSVNTKFKKDGTPNPLYDPSKPEGSLIYKIADDVDYTYTKTYKNGKTVTKTGQRHQKSTKMAETDDAYSLVSPAKHPMELLYADYANSMKALANKARLEEIATGNLKYDKNAKKTYQAEYDSLMSKLNNAQMNAAKERQALRMANADVNAKLASGQIEKKDTKKVGTQALTKYREEYSSVSRRDRNIFISDREWEAIQAGAISETKLKQILDNADADDLRQRATPKTVSTLSSAQIARIKAYAASNYSIADIAKKMGKSPSTISKYMKGAN
jgi:DNA-binding CsgD family transcriptional regulator